MAAIDLAHDSIWRVDARDGAGAAALFGPDALVADPSGRQYRGRQAIAAFVDASPPGTLAQLAERAMGTGHAVLHGVIQTPGLSPAQVEWVFETDGDQIRRLEINHLPG
ncbi:MAG TPA: hypothetical protein VFN57_18405 [Thermomicrobiaceae bacterium]|nr:hypothetical protein [Thermomicrobiaceae bacterium]